MSQLSPRGRLQAAKENFLTAEDLARRRFLKGAAVLSGAGAAGAVLAAGADPILDLPEHIKPLLLIPVGFPAEKPEAKLRLSVTEAVTEI